ncbi:MAG: dihydroneopterin aldolase [Rickettsiella sp.]|nr:dihydroneopterin aldolase [Rickettsiella sp.]
MYCRLILKNLNLDVKLGQTEKERSTTQSVLVEIKLQFTEVPAACITDKLKDTFCYAVLSHKLQEFCNNRSFKLIEFLSYQIYQFLKDYIAKKTSEKIDVFLYVTKNPPLNKLEQSSFSISD